jgi:hypothetical protein
MKKGILLTLIILLLGITSYAQEKIEISLKNSSREESQTRDQLQRLLKTYDLSKWILRSGLLRKRKGARTVFRHQRATPTSVQTERPTKLHERHPS